MSTLSWFNARLLLHPDNLVLDKLSWHRAMYQATKMNVCLVDTSGLSKQYGDGLDITPLSLPITDVRNLDNGRYWHHNVNLLMDKLSTDLIQQVPPDGSLRLAYSGGTDSCLALAAILQNPLSNRLVAENRFVIATTPAAKYEDVEIWNKIQQSRLPIELMSYDEEFYRPGVVNVSGEGEGFSEWFKPMKRVFSDDEVFTAPYHTVEFKVRTWFNTREPTGIAWEYFNALTKHHQCPTLFHAWHCFEGMCAEQCSRFRSTAYNSSPQVMCEPKGRWNWIFMDSDFWDMCEYQSSANIYRTEDTLKYTSLQYIAQWMGWSSVKPKPKRSSQILIPKLFYKQQIFTDSTYSTDMRL